MNLFPLAALRSPPPRSPCRLRCTQRHAGAKRPGIQVLRHRQSGRRRTGRPAASGSRRAAATTSTRTTSHGRLRRRRRLRRAARLRHGRIQRLHLRRSAAATPSRPSSSTRARRLSDPFVIEKIRNAEAIFIAGGDQSNYIRYWKDTPVEDAINFVAAKPAPIGGTSAGMAVLGEYVYSAEGEESLTSAGRARRSLRAGPDAGPRISLAAATRERHHRPAPPGARPHRAHGRPALAAAGGRLVRSAARDRGRPRDGAAHRPRDRHGRGLCDGRPPDALRVFHGAGRTAVAVQSGRAAHDRARLPSTGSGPAGASTSRRGAGNGGIAYELRVEDGVLHSSRESNY